MKRLLKACGIIVNLSIVFVFSGCKLSVKNEKPNVDPKLSYEECKAIPLTLEAIDSGSIILTNPAEFTGLKYQKNDEEKVVVPTTETTATITIEAGDTVSFFAEGPVNDDWALLLQINCNSDCYIYGNVMSLIDSTDFKNSTKVEKKVCFYRLFYNNSHIKNHSLIALVLPATTLSDSCYNSMFSGCTGLIQAPELPATTLANACYKGMFAHCSNLLQAHKLPATTLADHCYEYMFSECTNLIQAPKLPATTLADYCYEYMFADCSSLKKAPDLPATTLADYCYYAMFFGCSGLTKAPALPATTLKPSCYSRLFKGCTSLTKAPKLPSMNLARDCYSYMFWDCTNLSQAPKLPATTVEYGCYYGMFQGCSSLTQAPDLPAPRLPELCYYCMFCDCTNLNYVKCLATNISERMCTDNWLSNVSSTGTFVKAANMKSWSKNSSSGIPTGWTVQNAE